MVLFVCEDPVLNAHRISITGLLKLLSLGHPIILMINSEPHEMSHHTQTSAVPAHVRGWPCPAPFLSEETGEVVFSYMSLFPPGGTGKGNAAVQN